MRRPLHIEYRRPPDHSVTYVQELIYDGPEVKVSFQEAAPISRPLTVEGRTILQPGAPVVWFTFPGRWHDIGRFHLVDGTFTGFYANILTPVRLHSPATPIHDPAHWRTTDLFLDVWIGADGTLALLDEDEWEAARRSGDLTDAEASRARTEADALLAAARRDLWPPPIVYEWTLERARDC